MISFPPCIIRFICSHGSFVVRDNLFGFFHHKLWVTTKHCPFQVCFVFFNDMVKLLLDDVV